MAHPEVVDEIFALNSIFCNQGEFDLLNPSSLEALEGSQGPISFKIAVKCNSNQDTNEGAKCFKEEQNMISSVVEMSVTLQLSYPRTLPEISLSCTEMTKKNLSSLREKMMEYTTNLLTSNPEPMIMDLTLWLQENAGLFCDKSASNHDRNNDSRDNTILLLKLDHMRNKSRYIKTITRWVNELKLSGRVFFAGYLLFILLTGPAEDVREYLRRHKTCSVDVDSSGKPCKERMMNVLVQEQASTNLR